MMNQEIQSCGQGSSIYFGSSSFPASERVYYAEQVLLTASCFFQVSCIGKITALYPVGHFNFFHDIKAAWGDITDNILYLVSKTNGNQNLNLSSCSWTVTVLEAGGTSLNQHNAMSISRLEELPLTICRINKKAMCGHTVTVGYIMKSSRETDFAKRGAFPMYPSQNGLIFLPLTFNLPISSQIQEADIILHKATDEITSVELNGPISCPRRICFSDGFQELLRYTEAHPDCRLLDSINSIHPIIDRLAIQKILQGLQDLKTEKDYSIRAPRFLMVDNFSDPELAKMLEESSLSFPYIVKPQVACGVADAHSMAIAFKVEDFRNLAVPLPAVIQEYVNHSSTIYKFYVLGEKVFYATKKSTPNADILIKLSEQNGVQPLLFDSLKSLPIATDSQSPNEEACMKSGTLDLELATDAAAWLRNRLGLTIIGFDVVIQEGTRDHVIVDVNYLPSFKEVPDIVAIPAFWDSIKKKFESIKTKAQMYLRTFVLNKKLQKSPATCQRSNCSSSSILETSSKRSIHVL
uniref:inositol-1,3,4-trisphosphate 5/6-kinase n=1 Tax=Kalanchoe fedtschenkoi TaxID=63787 RepID=A0A7N0U7H5_KALFE